MCSSIFNVSGYIIILCNRDFLEFFTKNTVKVYKTMGKKEIIYKPSYPQYVKTYPKYYS